MLRTPELKESGDKLTCKVKVRRRRYRKENYLVWMDLKVGLVFEHSYRCLWLLASDVDVDA